MTKQTGGVNISRVSGGSVNFYGDVNATTYIYNTTPTDKPLQRPPRAEHFIGRKKELDKLLTDLQPGRVVMLCGVGGIGKTALTAEAVHRLTPNSVGLVEARNPTFFTKQLSIVNG